MKAWGKQNTKCAKCLIAAVQTFETYYDDNLEGHYCIRYFERLCVVCFYWSGWIWLDNGQIKIPIEAQ